MEKESQRLFQTLGHEQKEIAQTDKQIEEESVRLAQTRQTLQADEKLTQTVAALPELRAELDHLKAERSLL